MLPSDIQNFGVLFFHVRAYFQRHYPANFTNVNVKKIRPHWEWPGRHVSEILDFSGAIEVF